MSFLFRTSLILFDFNVYIFPILITCLISNLYNFIIWFFPSLCKIYTNILSNEDYSRPFKFVTIISSPLIVLLYLGAILPLSLQACVAYSIFITLILPIMLYFQRPEYPYHEESALMSIMFLLSQMFRGNFIKEQLIDSPIVRPIQDTIYLDKKISELYSTTIPKKIIQSVDFFYRKLRIGIVIGFCIGFCAIPVALICLFIEPPFDRAIKQLKQLSSQWATRRDGKDRKSNSSNHIEGNLLNILCSVVLLFCLKVAMLVPLILFVTGFYLYGLSIYVYLGIERIFQFICQNIFYPSVIIICSLKSGIDSTSYFPLVGLEKEF
ncbi:hypothetical protein C2G38_2088680 [Gigaspora rosea]|uniref:Uncharacterized protein n=1 Tax=Gigaspora rosea TaxID=44941 RepID=A0A397VD94_9GLOM|nr:hypothetical protein C2G38_2088680 [Gigaspora rosea]